LAGFARQSILLIEIVILSIAGLLSTASQIRSILKKGEIMTNNHNGPTIGLALGGGGARGLAHIGVLLVLERAGIPIHFLSGTSMGGIIAAGYAAGLSAEKLQTEAVSMAQLRKLARLLNLEPLRTGLFNLTRIRNFFNDLLGADRTFESLELPLTLTAVDLYGGQEVLINQGPLVEAVLATMAVPGLIPPVEIRGRRLIDGGVRNNVPADVARDWGADVVIAVEIGLLPFSDKEEWKQAKHFPLFAVLPHYALDGYQTGMIMVTALAQEKLRLANPDVVIRPTIHRRVPIITGLLRPEEIIAAGVSAAEEALPAIKEAIDSKV
jgi:NTE family protein